MKAAFWQRFSRKGKKTPLFQQVHGSECGAACLGIVLAHYGCWVNMGELRDACSVSRDGCNAADLQRAAADFGLDCTGWRREPEQLRKLKLPAILFWEFDHFVVLEGFRGENFLINDPANGHLNVSGESFSKRFTGVVLELAPNESFRKFGQRPSIWKGLAGWFRQHRPRLLFCVLLGLLLVAPGIGLPLLVSNFVDRVLVGGEPIGQLVVLATISLALLNFLLVWVQQRILRNLSITVSVEQAERFLDRILRLPINYFFSRYAGDLTQRTQLIDNVAGVATLQLTRTTIELFMSLAFLAAMLWLDVVMALLVVLIAGVGLTMFRVISRFRLDENHSLRREQGQMAGVGNFGARNLHSIRAAGNEDGFFTTWSGYQSRELTARQRFRELGLVASSMPVLMTMVGSIVVLGLGGLQVMSGRLSVGELMAFYFISGNFLIPVSGFIQSWDTIQILNADLSRINDVTESREDSVVAGRGSGGSESVSTIDGRLRLAGYLEMRGISFGYKKNRDPLLRDFNLKVRPGQRIAIVGPSGSGKSTVARLISGAYDPWQGEILFDGRGRLDVPRNILNESIAFVDQQIVLFSGTVRENLTMWNASVPDELVFNAARDATIHEDIVRRRLDYLTHVEEGGTNFSGGQRQRLEIARALVTNPSIIVLDEATSSLDASLESRIDDALRRRGCSCIIIAHRLSTIRDCDEIIVLYKGFTVQRGSHDELMRDKSGMYRELVSNH